MKKIDSFTVNHQTMTTGLYVSRLDGDITTLDLRMRRPYIEDGLTHIEMHSLEHLLATALRNGTHANHVVYVGPMGCATGFYVLYQGLTKSEMLTDLIDAFKTVTTMDTMPGDSPIECGNNRTLDVGTGKDLASKYWAIIKDKVHFDNYPA